MAIIILLVNYCGVLFSQNLVFTREFPTVRKNVPLQIINNSPGHFFVLRYNKEGHDFTVEKRNKPQGEIVAFTPLKLDSVNSALFDYERLDYLLCEDDGRVFFFFEKYLNTRKAIYVKVLDAGGKTNGFKELAFLEKEKLTNEFRFLIKETEGHHVLIVGEQYYTNGTAKKVVMLYDLQTNKERWIKKLPLENAYTGFSRGFECNEEGDLFYVLARGEIASYRRKFVANAQISVPVFSYDSLSIVSFLNNDKAPARRGLLAPDSFGIKSITIYADKISVAALLHQVKQEELVKDTVFFSTQKFSKNLDQVLCLNKQSLDKDTEKKLTFYDASDSQLASEKDHFFLEKLSDPEHYYTISERAEENYSKELLFWKTKRDNGQIAAQKVIPRKIFFFDDRTRYKNIGTSAQILCNGDYSCFLLEDEDNEKRRPEDFNFHRFSRQKYLWGANLVAYTIRQNNEMTKAVIYRNKGYDFVPLNYSSNQCDFVFYLNKGKTEKFAIYAMSQL